MIAIHYYQAKVVCDHCNKRSVLADPKILPTETQSDAVELARHRRWLVLPSNQNHDQIHVCPDCMLRALFVGILK